MCSSAALAVHVLWAVCVGGGGLQMTTVLDYLSTLPQLWEWFTETYPYTRNPFSLHCSLDKRPDTPVATTRRVRRLAPYLLPPHHHFHHTHTSFSRLAVFAVAAPDGAAGACGSLWLASGLPLAPAGFWGLPRAAPPRVGVMARVQRVLLVPFFFSNGWSTDSSECAPNAPLTCVAGGGGWWRVVAGAYRRQGGGAGGGLPCGEAR